MEKVIKYEDIKRVIDIGISCGLIVILSPVFGIVSIYLKNKENTIIFKQKRVGKNGQIFDIYKFRTIYVRDGKDILIDNGDFLRKYGIDELPQLLNVIKGDMSIIGPRPRVSEYYKNMTEEQKKSLDVRPGIISPSLTDLTGDIDILDKLKIESEYAQTHSLKRDLVVLRNLLLNIKEIFEERHLGNKGNLINQAIDIELLKENLKRSNMNSTNEVENKNDSREGTTNNSLIVIDEDGSKERPKQITLTYNNLRKNRESSY